MTNYQYLMFVIYTSVLVLFTSLTCASADEERKVYIVYMGSLPRNQRYTPSSHHVSLIQKITGPNFSEKLIIRSYNRSFNGFVAKLTRDEVEELSSESKENLVFLTDFKYCHKVELDINFTSTMSPYHSGVEDVVSIFPDKKYQFMTTRSWDFLGFSETMSRSPQSESNIIIGFIDSGVWPELASFSDKGFGPPPTKWKGVCKGGKNFTCNNKIIGARYYGSSESARDDDDGHGSHVASIAAGLSVKDTSFFGLAQGTARGGAPSARIAAYKVCDPTLGCAISNILAAFDDAIADRVDILSVSLGFDSAEPLDRDPIAIGSFHAMANGILTSHAAGNSGNDFGVTSSVAPWLISVAASTIDRHIIDKAVLGSGKTIVGVSINSFDLNGTKYPLVHINSAEDAESFKGKIVGGAAGTGVASIAASGGAVGVLYLNDQFPNVSEVVPIPAVGTDETDYEAIMSYIQSSKAPVATILRSEEIKDTSAPVVASFSSCGPNSILQEIMKPDVTAPGVEILAGYSPISSASDIFGTDDRRVQYNILSGTSMACPHVSGIAAYVKSFHPDWSPSALRSAIMTTATPLDPTANPEGEFAYGSGQVNPLKATQPGLVYEVLEEDYIKLLCRAGFDEKKLRIITGGNSTCPRGSVEGPVLDFNYPSLTAKVNLDTPFTLRFQRTVTNVGVANSTYQAKVSPSRKFDVNVEPLILSFKSLKEKKAFNVTVSGKGLELNVFESAALLWSDGIHNVRTPIIVHTIDTSHPRV